jgi:hypothetical protein
LGFGEDLTKKVLEMKPVGFRGKLYSAEYKRHFETEHSVVEIKVSSNELDKLLLMIDGLGDVSWFKQKYQEFQERIGIKINQNVDKKRLNCKKYSFMYVKINVAYHVNLLEILYLCPHEVFNNGAVCRERGSSSSDS